MRSKWFQISSGVLPPGLKNGTSSSSSSGIPSAASRAASSSACAMEAGASRCTAETGSTTGSTFLARARPPSSLVTDAGGATLCPSGEEADPRSRAAIIQARNTARAPSSRGTARTPSACSKRRQSIMALRMPHTAFPWVSDSDTRFYSPSRSTILPWRYSCCARDAASRTCSMRYSESTACASLPSAIQPANRA